MKGLLQALEQLAEHYSCKRALLRAMPKGATCTGCPYWSDLDVKCYAKQCDANYREPDWEEIAREEQMYRKRVKYFFGDP
jgi:hypothetical protein